MRRQKGFLVKRLAKTLKKERGQRSQVQFARDLRISNATLNRLENESQNISIAMLERLCGALECDIAHLFRVGAED